VLFPHFTGISIEQFAEQVPGLTYRYGRDTLGLRRESCIDGEIISQFYRWVRGFSA